MENKAKKSYLSTSELAKKLGVSRVAVFNRIKSGQIPAEKIGRSYAIPVDYADRTAGATCAPALTPSQKGVVEEAVGKVVKEYGETLRLLGKE